MKRTLKLIIYAFAVLMILLRPFCAYRISMNTLLVKDPNRMLASLQRVIKKKETHAEAAEDAAEITADSSVVILPLIFALIIRCNLSRLLSLLTGNKLSSRFATVFQVAPCNDYYCWISRFQI
ncbi:hypothetical protein MTO98_06070 [Mucilaginibacter sp. SMC90]|uniref:hypothetical protein n=1 Tax=Mucilaginibacter sp. SMC90 TaxID=2929803 RepID=UPI001FB4E2E7|nr:hypothetical protein [Mucilaginibacter sp. SMC90]UOE50638.1 hypothetical protein MTO98_06070 [Mucilaginibacter sp. SMC90]